MVLILGLLITGFGQHAAKGAGEGATVGAASGAVGGLISTLVFGGDPAKAAARGAVYGGAACATSGATGGSRVDAQIEEQRQTREEALFTELEEFYG